MEIQATDKQQFDDLCRELNLDDATAKKAWDSYETISVNYTLEGDCLTWLTCAVYAASRQTITPTVCNGTMEGNCTSLTRLLKYSNLSLVQFFSKMKNWSDMANLPRNVCDKVDRLERNFAVSTVIFRKFEPIFKSIFNFKSEDPRPPRSRKQRRPPCSYSEVFAFCWDLFVLAKGNFPAISDDLVNSYHLLLCCVDLLFANAVIARRKNLLRAEFEGLPPGFLTDSMDLQNDSPPCIIDHLCSVFEGLVLEAKGIKEHFWKPYLAKKFDTRDLHGNRENLSGLLDPNNFENNCKNIRREYDEYVLKKGDFDERVFLEEDAHKQIGTPSKRDGADRNMSDEVSARRALKLEKHPQNFIPQTPLTNRRYLKEKEIRITPVSTATQIVSRLQALLSGQKSSPSEELSSMFQKCNEDPSEAILARVKEMGQTFCEKYTQPSDHGTGSPMDFAKRRLSLAESLYYSVLEKITKNEIQRLSESQDLSGLLGHETFHSCLFACCLEIIIFAYNSQRVFPWILEVFNLHGYYFYRVIELLLRAEDGLPRDIVKHLNRTEEMILQEKAWASDSPLWQALEDCDREVPMCADCTPSNQVEAASPTQGSVMPQTMMSPMRHPRIQELSGPLHNKDPLSSPASARDRFSSPAPGSAKRRLFSDEASPASSSSSLTLSSTEPVTLVSNTKVHSKPVSTASLPCSPASNNNNVTTTASAPTTPVKTQTVILTIKAEPGQKLLLVTTGGQQGGSTTVIPQSKGGDTLPTETVTQQQTLSSSYIKPKRTGSLGMFFRKVYHVLNIRLRDMCAKLSISEELRRKIWTCLEHCLVNHINMMKDRNIDQLLLCSIYIICRVTDQPNSFQNIMKCYRRQPQADSHVYRSVLLSKNDSPQKEGATTRKEKTLPQTPEKQKGRSRSANLKAASSGPPTPTRMSGTSTSFETEERGDLVAFYNSVYVKVMNDYAKKFQLGRDPLTSNQNEPPLSPLPKMRAHHTSPRKVSRKHELYVSPHKKAPSHLGVDSPTTVMRYMIQKSPSKNLNDINRMLRTKEAVHKKRALLQEDGSDSPSKKSKLLNSSGGSIVVKRLQTLQQGTPEGV